MQQPSGIMGAAAKGNSADASLGGLAQGVDTKVEAYRNNPQALEKRLQGNQQLIDLLALQKVKSEKESAKNQLLLSEQQNPNTIAQQLEAEVVGMNKDEMSKQTAGILGQRQKQQQKNMQRTAKGASQGAPVMAARGGLMPLPRQNMANMAQGGIIGYDGGGPVGHAHPPTAAPATAPTAPAIDSATEAKLIKALGKDYQQKLAGMSEKARKSAVAGLKLSSEMMGRLDQVIDAVTFIPRKIGEGITAVSDAFRVSPTGQALLGEYGYEPKSKVEKERVTPLTFEELQAGAVPKSVVPPTVTEPVVTTTTAPTKIKPDPTIEEKINTVMAGTGTPTAVNQNAVSDRLEESGITSKLQEQMAGKENQTVVDNSEAARKRADVGSRREENRAEAEAGIATLKDMTTAAKDPDKLRRERRKGIFAGAARAGGRGILDASMNMDRQQENFGFSKQREAMAATNEKIKNDLTASNISQTSADKVYGALTKSSSDAMAVMANVTAQDVEAADRQIKQAFDEKKLVIDAGIKGIELELEKQMVDAKGQSNKLVAIQILTDAVLTAKVEQETLAAEVLLGEGAAIDARFKEWKDSGEVEPFEYKNDVEKAEHIAYTGMQDKLQDAGKAFTEATTLLKEFTSDNKSGTFGGK